MKLVAFLAFIVAIVFGLVALFVGIKLMAVTERDAMIRDCAASEATQQPCAQLRYHPRRN